MKKEVEIWKLLPSNENYLVSDLGRVQSLPRLSESGRKLKGKILNLTLDGRYYRVRVGKKKKLVHKLIAEAFLGHVSNGMETVVDHKNNISTDNNLANLQLISQRQNCSKDKSGTSKHVGVCWDRVNNKWKSAIRINGNKKHLGRFTDELEAAKAYQIALNNHSNK